MMTKPFIVLMCVLILTNCTLAQDKMLPLIAWNNLQEKYENPEDVKPTISIVTVKPIFVFAAPSLAVLFRLNEQTKKWERLAPHLCGFATGKVTPTKFYSSKKIKVSFDGRFHNLSPSPFMPPLELTSQTIQSGKYKFKLYYGLVKSNINLVSESPEFEFVEYNPK